MATPTTNSALPQVDTQQTLWPNANETLIAPQLLLITEPNTTIITANNSTADSVESQIKNNNNNNEQESNLADVPPEPSGGSSSVSEETVTVTPKSVATLQAPKSPPRWPLRPGVMLHVSRDTKQNLAVNRMTLKPQTIDRKSSSNNTSIISESSGVIFTSSPLRPKQTALALNFDAVASLPQSAPESTNQTNREQNSSGKFERRVQQFLVNLFRRAKGASSDSTRDSQRSHVGLLSGMIFGRRQPSDTQFDTQHRLKGIRCSGSGKK